MDLVDRYLNAVRFWLPKAQKQDIISVLGARASEIAAAWGPWSSICLASPATRPSAPGGRRP